MTVLRDVRSVGWESAASHEPTVLFLHGYRSHEHDLAGLAPVLAIDGRWASLRAPIDMVGGGAAWVPIETPGNPEPAATETATEAIWAWIDENVAEESAVVPIGFSQGGLMASQLLRTRPDRVPATVILGGFVLGATQPADETLLATKPPVFWGRGAEDHVIAPHAIERTTEWLPSHSTLSAHVYPGLAHGIDAAELADVRAFLDAHGNV